jgi:hypothetical protein
MSEVQHQELLKRFLAVIEILRHAKSEQLSTKATRVQKGEQKHG